MRFSQRYQKNKLRRGRSTYAKSNWKDNSPANTLLGVQSVCSHVCVSPWASLSKSLGSPFYHSPPRRSLASEVYCWWHANTPLNLPIAVGARTKHLNSHSQATGILIRIYIYVTPYEYICDGGCWLSACLNGILDGREPWPAARMARHV